MKNASEDFLIDLGIAVGLTYLLTKTKMYHRMIEALADGLDSITKVARK